MKREGFVTFTLAACLAFAACGPGPSSSGSAPSGRDGAAVIERKIDHLEGLLARRPAAGRVMDELISALPDRAWLTGVAYDGGKVRIKGVAPSNNALADYISRLGDSPALTGLTLGASTMKTVRGRESWEFSLEAVARDPQGGAAPAPGDPAARLSGLERSLTPRQDSAATLRDVQRLALDSGLQMTRFAPGAEVSGEFTVALPVSIELRGDRNEVARYLRGLAALPGLWVVERFSLEAVSPGDPRSPVRATIAQSFQTIL